MALSVYNIKKWTKMLTGNSEMHVHQTMGKSFKKDYIEGYFNNLTEKVLKEPQFLDTSKLPMYHAEQGDVIFPVTIFQYALGAYDLYLQTKNSKYIKKFIQLANWTLESQKANGAWNNFGFIYPNAPYGAMCQGEGISVLVRAYKNTQDSRYLMAAIKAEKFMVTPRSKGGTVEYDKNDIFYYEFTNKPVVMNGWIFSIFGVYDLWLATKENKYKILFDKSVATLSNNLDKFDNGFWSMYNLDGEITSPFYHNLHIAQLEALYIVTNNEKFLKYKDKFKGYQDNKFNAAKAFIVKAAQKLKE